MTEFPLAILSPENVVFQGKIVSLVAPGQKGYLGVMAHHAPLLAGLTVGEVKLTDVQGNTSYFAVTGGVLEVDPEEATILADVAERAEQIDIRRAEEARDRAAARLARRNAELDVARAQAALMRALNRLHVASRQEKR